MISPASPPLIVAVDDEDLGQQITLLAGQINAANHRLLKLIAEFDTRKGWVADGTIPSCAFWLNWKCGIATSAAREKVRVAHALEVLPQIDAAFAAGEISYSKVRAMTRVATAENEDYLLMIARHGTASHIEKLVRKYRSVQAKSGGDQEAEQAQARQLSYYQDDDGMWVIHAKLPAEEGSLVVKAIEAVARRAQEECQHKIQQEVESANCDPVLQEVSAETSAPSTTGPSKPSEVARKLATLAVSPSSSKNLPSRVVEEATSGAEALRLAPPPSSNTKPRTFA